MSEKTDIQFIGIGMPRAGTTWMSKCLDEHPEICLSHPKETDFFNILIDQGKNISDYERFYSHCNAGVPVKGEFSVAYFKSNECLKRIKEAYPDIKILISLRNPMERAFSHYTYRKKKVGMKEDFLTAIKNDTNGVRSMGMYDEVLERVYNIFDPENVLVLIHDDYKIDPEKLIQSIYSFLKVDPTFIPKILRMGVNTTQNVNFRLPVVQKWQANLRTYIKRHSFFSRFIPVLKALGLSKLNQKVENLNRDTMGGRKQDGLHEEERNTLYDIYASDIALLEKRLGRDLYIWKPSK